MSLGMNKFILFYMDGITKLTVCLQADPWDALQTWYSQCQTWTIRLEFATILELEGSAREDNSTHQPVSNPNIRLNCQLYSHDVV